MNERRAKDVKVSEKGTCERFGNTKDEQILGETKSEDVC